MLEQVKESFRDFIAAVQIARLYSCTHPQFKAALAKAYESVQIVVKEKEPLVFGIIGDELAFEKEIFFDLSKIERPMIVFLKERGIERIEFHRALTQESMAAFISVLITPKNEIKHSIEEMLKAAKLQGISAGKIKSEPAVEGSERKEVLMDYLELYEDALKQTTGFVDNVMDGKEIEQLALRLHLNTVMENLLGRYQDFLNFGTMKRYDSRTYFHTFNVSILAMYFASKIGFSQEQVIQLGSAALFHDIGKIYISRKILQKPARLDDQEFAKIKNHVTHGTEILIKHTDALGYLPALVCFEHHLRYDLSGYPKLAYPRKPHILSQIITLCDVYDALSQRRTYKNDYPPRMIYDIMTKEKGSTFEPKLFDAFFRVLGIWPIGTIVSLSDGSIAVVREENEDDINSPKVEVIFPHQEPELIDLRKSEGKNKIEHSLNPLGEGKEYLSLAVGSPKK
jgi:putative nucleotidyltransferase with HDIG domain